MRNQLNLTKAADIAKNAIYPKKDAEYEGIIIPSEWKQMEPLSKNTKSYRVVKWGTIAVLVLLTVLLVIVLSTDWLGSSFFSLAYIFFVIISSVRHRGNLFILPKGIILNGRFVSEHQISLVEIERIIRWHSLYGLDEKVNNAYKLTFRLKRTIFQPNFFVIRTADQLEQITTLLQKKGIPSK